MIDRDEKEFMQLLVLSRHRSTRGSRCRSVSLDQKRTVKEYVCGARRLGNVPHRHHIPAGEQNAHDKNAMRSAAPRGISAPGSLGSDARPTCGGARGAARRRGPLRARRRARAHGGPPARRERAVRGQPPRRERRQPHSPLPDLVGLSA